jgi:hypothetical protein
MQPIVTVMRHRLSIWLLSLAMATPFGVCIPWILEEKEEQKAASQEEDRAENRLLQVVQHRRVATHLEQIAGISLPPLALHTRDVPWLGQVCVAAGQKGEHQSRNGCGAWLLR